MRERGFRCRDRKDLTWSGERTTTTSIRIPGDSVLRKRSFKVFGDAKRYRFSAFWLRSSVVSVLFRLIPETRIIDPLCVLI